MPRVDVAAGRAGEVGPAVGYGLALGCRRWSQRLVRREQSPRLLLNGSRTIGSVPGPESTYRTSPTASGESSRFNQTAWIGSWAGHRATIGPDASLCKDANP